MMMNPNVVRGASGQAAVKQGFFGRALSNVSNLFMMVIPAVGLVSKPFTFLYEKSGAQWAGKAGRFMQIDRQLHVTSPASLVGKGKELMGVHAPAVAAGIESMGDKVESAIAGQVNPGAITTAIEKGLNAVGGGWIFKKIQGLNRSAAQNHHEQLVNGFEKITGHLSSSGLAGHPEARALQAELSAIQSKIGSVESIASHGKPLQQEMTAIFKKIGDLRKTVGAKESGVWNTLHRDTGTVVSDISHVLNKSEKAGYSGIAQYLSNLPKRMSNLNFTQIGGLALNVGIAASSVSENVGVGRDNLRELRAVYQGMTGKTATDKQLLFGKDVPQEIVTLRKSMRGTVGNMVANVASLGVAQTMWMRGGMKGMMLGSAAQMLGNTVAGYLIPKSASLGAASVITHAKEAGTPVKATDYIELLANVSKTTQQNGLYGAQNMRADYLALYAEEKQLSAGETLALASKAGSDPVFKAQITGEVDVMLAARKAANETSATLASQSMPGETLGTAADINPLAKTGHVKALEAQRATGRTMQAGIA